MNPPHMGIVADFNSAQGGLQRKPLVVDHNVVAFASEGEEVLLVDEMYKLVRKSDGKALTAPSILEMRRAYIAS
jgi:hypothetical protein